MATREEIQNMNFGVAAEMGPYGQQQGALRDILKITSGSSANADRAIALANQLMPMPEEADPYEAMFRYFSGMAKAASQPGATVLSSALAPMDVPLDYYTAKKKQSKESEQARMQAALSLGPSLKAPKTSKTDYIEATIDGIAGLYTSAEIDAAKAANKIVGIYEKETAGATGDLKPFGLVNPADLAAVQRIIPSAKIDAAGNILLTDAESKNPDVRKYIGQKITGETATGNQPKTAKDQYDILRYTGNPPEGKNIGDRVFPEGLSSQFTKDQNAVANSLRDDLSKTLTEFNDIKSTHKKTASFYYNPSAISDYSLAVNYAKIVDPGTAAREGEVAAIAGAGSVSGAFRAALTNALMGTGKLSDQMRAQIYNASLRIYQAEVDPAKKKVERYRVQSEKIKAGLFGLVGINVGMDDWYSVGDPEGKEFGAGDNTEATTYVFVDETAIASDPIDTTPTYNFPPNFNFNGLSRDYLNGLLQYPAGTLDRPTLDKINEALTSM